MALPKSLLLPVAVFYFLTSCPAQTQPETKTIYNPEFKWTISIPAGFDTIGATDQNRMQKRGTEAVEKTIGGKLENLAKTIFMFRSDRFNYFESNCDPFDPSKDGSYISIDRKTNQVVYETFRSQIQGMQLDSSSSTQMIDGLSFRTFQIDMTFPNGMALTWQSFSRLFSKKVFTVNILTADKQKQQALLDAWTNSTFGK